jgi:hypothetical protein
MRLRSTTLAATALFGTVLVGGASAGTKIVSSWREPSAGPLQFKKVLVLCFAAYDSQRLFGEVELIRLMKRTQGVAAHTIMTVDEVKDEKKMRDVIAKDGFDGVVTFRVVGNSQQVSTEGGYLPGSSTFWYYYGAWPMGMTQNYVRTDRQFQVEVQVFSIKDDKLIWSGLTESSNPKDAKEIVNGVAKAVGKEMRKQKLLD